MSTRKKMKPLERGFVLFNLTYEDGSLSSNRRVPIEIVNGYEGAAGVRRTLEEQDAAIAERAGRPALKIKSIVRVKS